MKFPVITPAIVAKYHSATDQFLIVIDLCETTTSAYDTKPRVRRHVDFVETVIDLADQAAQNYHRDQAFHEGD